MYRHKRVLVALDGSTAGGPVLRFLPLPYAVA